MIQIKSLLRYFIALSALYLFTGTVSFADHLSALDLNGRYAEITKNNHERALAYNTDPIINAFFTVEEITIPMVLLSNCVKEQKTFEECWNGGISEFWNNCVDRQLERGVVGYTYIVTGCDAMHTDLLIDILNHELLRLKSVVDGWIDDTVDLQQRSWKTYLDTKCELGQSLLASGMVWFTPHCRKEGYLNRILEVEQLCTNSIY